MWDPFLYGVCYYPEHWHPDRHERDIARMAGCGFNLIRLGEGAWSYWEPTEGKFQFDLFDRVIDLCRRHDIKVIMGTPTYAAPAWVATDYPEVLRWNFQRIPMNHGGRRIYNYTSPKYLDLSDRICAALADHYRDEPQIIAWQLDNEFNCHMDVSYAPSDTIAFRAWLKEKYGTPEALNDAWGTAFWSQTYTDWRQIDLPHPTATVHNPTQLLDETRFISDCVTRFARRQADILRAREPRWKITHNGLFPNIDGRSLVRQIDFFSHDQYPLFWNEWTGQAFPLQQARSLSCPFAILEQQAGPGGQMEYLQRTPLPGQLRLWAWQSVFHGAGAVCHFRWRTCPYGSEQHWHGLLDPDDRDNRRIREASAVAEEIRRAPRDFLDAPITRAVAVLRDFDNETNDRRINTYNRSGAWEQNRWIAGMSRRHVPVDIVWPDSDLSDYRLLIAPHLRIVDEAIVSACRAFVHAGGTLVLGAQSGLKNRNCHLVEMPPPGLWRDLAGVEIEDFTALPDPDETRAARLIGGAVIELSTVVERIAAFDAEPLAYFLPDPLLGAAPAVTRRRVGAGSVCYIAGYCLPQALAALAPLLLNAARIAPLIEASEDIEAIARRGAKADYLGLLNHGDAAQRVVIPGTGTDLLTGAPLPPDGLLLPPFGAALVERS